MKAGELYDCWNCGEKHELKESEPPGLLYYTCDDGIWLAAVDGMEVEQPERDTLDLVLELAEAVEKRERLKAGSKEAIAYAFFLFVDEVLHALDNTPLGWGEWRGAFCEWCHRYD